MGIAERPVIAPSPDNTRSDSPVLRGERALDSEGGSS
jgi:hypothetical protein